MRNCTSPPAPFFLFIPLATDLSTINRCLVLYQYITLRVTSRRPLPQVDAMVDFRSLVDSFDFEAFPWSERCGHACTVSFRVVSFRAWCCIGVELLNDPIP